MYASCMARITSMTSISTLFVEIEGGGLTNFLMKLASNCDPPHLYFLSNWDYTPQHPA
jgi:hypothetical protein